MDIRCAHSKQLFHQRYDFAADDKWALTYGIKDTEFMGMADNMPRGTQKVDFAKMRTGPQYKCPYCGNKDFVRCGKCHALTCYDDSGVFTCAFCGHSGRVTGVIDSLEGTQGEAQ